MGIDSEIFRLAGSKWLLCQQIAVWIGICLCVQERTHLCTYIPTYSMSNESSGSWPPSCTEDDQPLQCRFTSCNRTRGTGGVVVGRINQGVHRPMRRRWRMANFNRKKCLRVSFRQNLNGSARHYFPFCIAWGQSTAPSCRSMHSASIGLTIGIEICPTYPIRRNTSFNPSPPRHTSLRTLRDRRLSVNLGWLIVRPQYFHPTNATMSRPLLSRPSKIAHMARWPLLCLPPKIVFPSLRSIGTLRSQCAICTMILRKCTRRRGTST